MVRFITKVNLALLLGHSIPKWVLKTYDGIEDGIVLTQDRDKWREPLNTVINPRFP